mmetsp:Transcript_22472/g.31250  ORF Transcript_22472/g.31250 Transcript_22472/m.31250 type:complete len:137 (+) Transcript_22472:1225-1635(+)
MPLKEGSQPYSFAIGMMATDIEILSMLQIIKASVQIRTTRYLFGTAPQNSKGLLSPKNPSGSKSLGESAAVMDVTTGLTWAASLVEGKATWGTVNLGLIGVAVVFKDSDSEVLASDFKQVTRCLVECDTYLDLRFC